MTLEELNSINENELREHLAVCCGSTNWQTALMQLRPFSDTADLFDKSLQAWNSTTESDWLEAFSHHPKIGDLESLKKKFANSRHLAGAEQASVQHADDMILKKLAAGNDAYEKKFGFIFIVCATGKQADEMLALLEIRLPNDRETELKTAAAEQHKITTLRLQKLIA